jgi:integrase
MGVHRLVSAGLDNERFSIGLSNGDFDYSHWTTRCSLKCLGSVAHNYLQRHLKPLAERLSVEGVTFQALRRTFATLTQRKGPKNAQTQLRHSDIAMTLGTYAQPISEEVKAAVESLNTDLEGVLHDFSRSSEGGVQ